MKFAVAVLLGVTSAIRYENLNHIEFENMTKYKEMFITMKGQDGKDGGDKKDDKKETTTGDIKEDTLLAINEALGEPMTNQEKLFIAINEEPAAEPTKELSEDEKKAAK